MIRQDPVLIPRYRKEELLAEQRVYRGFHLAVLVDVAVSDDAFAVHDIESGPTVDVPNGRDWAVAALLQRWPGHAGFFSDGTHSSVRLINVRAWGPNWLFTKGASVPNDAARVL